MSTDSTAQPVAPRTNWAGNLTYRAGRFVVPASVEEAREAVRAADKVRVVGSRHSFNDIADTTGTHLSLERLNRVLCLDTAKRQVIVEGGIRYGEIGPYLHEQRIRAAQHGIAAAYLDRRRLRDRHAWIGRAGQPCRRGRRRWNSSTARAILSRFRATKDGDMLAGAVVNLGALGVVTKLTLDLQPAFHIRQDVFRDLPLAALENHFDEIMSSGYSVSMFTGLAVRHDRAGLDQERRASRARHSRPGILCSARGRPRENMHPIAGLDAVNCTEQMGVVGPWPTIGFRISAWGSRRQAAMNCRSSILCRCEHAVGAIRALAAAGRPAGAAPVDGREIRTIAADELWMSPCYRTAVRGLPFFLQAGLACAAGASARPRRGACAVSAASALGQDVHDADRESGRTIRGWRISGHCLTAHDPSGKFRNAFIEHNIFN